MPKILVMSYKATHFALVDREDYNSLVGYNWYPQYGNNTVYAAARINKHPILMHNFLLGNIQVDHKDGNGLNNRRQNLREASHSQNQANSIKTRGSSIYKGVTFEIQTRKWKAHIGLGQTAEKTSIVRTIGRFASEEDAAKAYDKEAVKLWGEFANLNFPRIEV